MKNSTRRHKHTCCICGISVDIPDDINMEKYGWVKLTEKLDICPVCKNKSLRDIAGIDTDV